MAVFLAGGVERSSLPPASLMVRLRHRARLTAVELAMASMLPHRRGCPPPARLRTSDENLRPKRLAGDGHTNLVYRAYGNPRCRDNAPEEFPSESTCPVKSTFVFNSLATYNIALSL